MVRENGVWLIPDDSEKPQDGRVREVAEELLPPLVRRLRYQRVRNNHFGIYEYIQVNLAYQSGRMASNRLTRKQIEEVYRTGRVSVAFEPMRVDDLVETVNHFRCVREMIDTVMQTLTVSLVRRYHGILCAGTVAANEGGLRPGTLRPDPELSPALTDLLRTYERGPQQLEQLLQLHIDFMHLRPFEDYNGRLGRILLLKECLRQELPPFLYPDKSRAAYNKSIRDRDLPALLALTAQAQERFKRKEELCRLMRYHRY